MERRNYVVCVTNVIRRTLDLPRETLYGWASKIRLILLGCAFIQGDHTVVRDLLLFR
jgi:hypothetical protein